MTTTFTDREAYNDGHTAINYVTVDGEVEIAGDRGSVTCAPLVGSGRLAVGDRIRTLDEGSVDRVEEGQTGILMARGAIFLVARYDRVCS